MRNYTKKIIAELAIILCLLSLNVSALNAQIRNRSTRDSVQAQINGYWYNPDNYQFDIQYPKLQIIPPLTTSMDFETLLAYIYLDSLMRNTNKEQLWQICLNRWFQERTKNDTLIQAVKYLYKLIDFDPIRFNQYSESTNSMYTLNLIALRGIIDRLLDVIVRSTTNQVAINDLEHADYILRVHVNSVVSLPRRGYPNREIRPNQFVYKVNAIVLDTLKGKVIQQCTYQSMTQKNFKGKTLNFNSYICFKMVDGPYWNTEIPFKTDPFLLDSLGNLNLQVGQDLLVFIEHDSYLWDFNYDYFSLSLLKALPIIDGQVSDISHVWSTSTLLNYNDWKNVFFQKRDLMLNGGY